MCKRFLAEGVSIVLVRSGPIRGTLFVPKQKGNKQLPAIITILGGLKKRGHVIESYAALMAFEGYVTLALAFFGVEGLQRTYTKQPIDMRYFEEAVEFLRDQESVDPDNIFVLGSSKGADIAFGMVSCIPQVKAICTFNGLCCSLASTTVYPDGTTIGMLPVDLSQVRPLLNADGTQRGMVDVSEAVAVPREHLDSVHRFHDTKASILMIVGEHDRNWNSSMFAKFVEDQLLGKSSSTRSLDTSDGCRPSNKCNVTGKRNKGASPNLQIDSYKHVGHLVEPPFFPICFSESHQLVPNKLLVDYGGGANPALNSKMQCEIWENVSNFFRQQSTSKVLKSSL